MAGDSRAWRLAAGAGLALLAVAALVAWRLDALSGGWLWALRLTGLLAVLGLLGVVALAARAALAPPPRREVVIAVPREGADGARLLPATPSAAAPPLGALLVAAVLASAPVLVVLVLAAPPAEHRGLASTGYRLPGSGPAPASAAPGGAPAPSAGPASGTPPAPAASAAPSSAAPSASSAATSAAAPSTGPPSTGPPSTGPPSPGPPAAGSPSTGAAGSSGTAGSCRHVVTAGETLWGIAAAQLGAGAGASAVQERWRALWAADRTAIGADPDLIRPGLVLSTCG